MKTALAVIQSAALAAEPMHESLREPAPTEYGQPVSGQVLASGEGWLEVSCPRFATLRCDVLHAGLSISYDAGDRVLLLPPASAHGSGIVLGKVAAHGEKVVSQRVAIDAGERVALTCGEATVDLRANGQVLIRGDDVLLRAKGTQRIRLFSAQFRPADQASCWSGA